MAESKNKPDQKEQPETPIKQFLTKYLPIARTPADLETYAEEEGLNPDNIIAQTLEYLKSIFTSDPESFLATVANLEIRQEESICYFLEHFANQFRSEIPKLTALLTRYGIQIPKEEIIIYIMTTLLNEPNKLSYIINSLGLSLFAYKEYLIKIIINKHIDEPDKILEVAETYGISLNEIENTLNKNPLPSTSTTSFNSRRQNTKSKQNHRRSVNPNHPDKPKPRNPDINYAPSNIHPTSPHIPQTKRPTPSPINHTLPPAQPNSPLIEETRKKVILNHFAGIIHKIYTQEITNKHFKIEISHAPPNNHQNIAGNIRILVSNRIRIIYKILRNRTAETQIISPETDKTKNPQIQYKATTFPPCPLTEEKIKKDIWNHLIDIFNI
ncbi:hypothetical protein KKG71_00410 [Patescibacteria group bacterium]|nr:hypothetical protein [Patescibacteria group bacterium]